MIEENLTYRPRIPRETRRLLVATMIALFALWALARVRFSDQPPANPVAPLLSQLTPRVRFEDLTARLTELRPRIEAAVQAVNGRAVLRAGPGIGVAFENPLAAGAGASFLAMDRASGVVVVEAAAPTAVSVSVWQPDRLDQPRYLVTARAGRGQLELAPVFAPSLDPVSNPLWPDMVWRVADDTALSPGAFVFTEDAQLVGLAWTDGEALAIIPAASLLAETVRILEAGSFPPGWLGIDVSSLSPSLAQATSASAGVVVTRVDGRSPSLALLSIGDVIGQADGQAVRSALEWTAIQRRLIAGQSLRLRVVRQGTARDVSVTAVPPPARAGSPRLGLEMRGVRNGAEVLRVDADSVAAIAGLRSGDVIIHAGDVAAPGPDRVRRLFAATQGPRPLLIAVSRGGTHHLLTLERNASERP